MKRSNYPENRHATLFAARRFATDPAGKKRFLQLRRRDRTQDPVAMNATAIVFCSVGFMVERVTILSPEKIVAASEVQALREQFPAAVVVLRQHLGREFVIGTEVGLLSSAQKMINRDELLPFLEQGNLRQHEEGRDPIGEHRSGVDGD